MLHSSQVLYPFHPYQNEALDSFVCRVSNLKTATQVLGNSVSLKSHYLLAA
jgi:hypothetical protein